MAGCALLGFLVALPAQAGLMTVRLARRGTSTLAVLNVGASILAGLGAAYCGMAVAQALTG